MITIFGLAAASRSRLGQQAAAGQPAAIETKRITPERAANELGQMRSALKWLQLMQKEQRQPKQGVLL